MTKRKKQSRRRSIRRGPPVAIIGLGYVGLPLAVLAAEREYQVTGIDHNQIRVRRLSKGINTLVGEERITDAISRKIFRATTNPSALRKAEIIILCVPTPVDHLYKPDLRPVIKATQTIARHLQRGQLIILESTVNPGVCEEIIQPILEKSALRAGRDFDLAHCPERINPGDTKWHVGNIPRCLGASSPKGAKRAAAFYRSILSAEVRIMKSLREAEATKIVENSFRDVNIAFVNELARSFNALDIDLYDVLQGAATKPFGFLVHYPSIGVGGHCIPVDPYYLIERAWQAGFDHKFLRLAREINNSMPSYAVSQLQLMLNTIRRPIAGTRIALLGLSYKANVGDLRESPSLKVQELLLALGAKLNVYDPYFPERSNAPTLAAALSGSEALILTVNHREFLGLKASELKRYGIRAVLDGKNALSKSEIQSAGMLYKGIGR